MLSDLKYALRQLRKSPGFTIMVLIIIGIGVGANSAIFSFVDGALLRPLPYPRPDRIVLALEKTPDGSVTAVSALNYLDWKKQSNVFEYIAAEADDFVTLTGIDRPEKLLAARVTTHYFDICGINAMLGRTFVAGEDQPGKDSVVVLSHALWKSQFGADPGIIGRSIPLDGVQHIVVGVLPKAFDRDFFQIWLPLTFGPDNMSRTYRFFWSLALLKPGVTLGQARAQMDAIGTRLAHEYPDSNKGWGISVELLKNGKFGRQNLEQSLYVLAAAVGMLLLIACANLANLSLTRGITRGREVAIRAALGAGRWRLIRQFVTESLLLSIGGGALGLIVGYVSLIVLNTAIPPSMLFPAPNPTMNGRVLLVTLFLSVLTGLLFGLVPAIQVTRPNLTNSMRQGGPGTSGGRTHQRVRSILVISEVALAFMLLAGAGLLIGSFFNLQRSDTGFDTTNVITAGLPTSVKRFPTPARLNLYFHQIIDRLGALPGVRNVALTSSLPMQGFSYGARFQIVGRTMVDPANRSVCAFKMVSSSYFKTLGMRLARGRLLSDRDVRGTPPVTVINEAMARKYFPNENPVGKRILTQEIVYEQMQLGPDIPWEIVGVVSDEKIGALNDKNEYASVYMTDDQSTPAVQSLIVRSEGDPVLLQREIQRVIHEIDKDQALPDMKTLEKIKSESMGNDRLRSTLLGIVAGIALLLSMIGLYGVISYSVVQRTREIGIRTALGANSRNIVGLILRNGMGLVGIGLVLGTAGALALSRLLSALLFGVGERDPTTLATVAGILACVALAACYIPAMGVYGVMAYSVSQRTNEIGIRMALGAQRKDVLRMILWRGARLTLVGLAAGLIGAFVLIRFIASLLYGTGTDNPLALIIATLALSLAAFAACVLPTLRAMNVNPSVALRGN